MRNSIGYMTKDGDIFTNFFLHPKACRMCSDTFPVFKVQISEEDRPFNKKGYWGWWDNKDQEFSMVFQHQNLLNMCFTYGPEIEEKEGKGIRLQVIIKIFEEVPI